MPEERQRRESSQSNDNKTFDEWQRELSDAIEELDKACARVRQVVYQLRPLVRTRREGSR